MNEEEQQPESSGLSEAEEARVRALLAEARHAEPMPEAVVARLEAAIADAEGHDPGTERFDQADARFHQILAQAAGNDLLLALTAWILEVLQPTLVAHIAVEVDGAAIIEQHRAILRAVRRRQRSAAERAMAAHIQYLVEVLEGMG